MRLRSYTAESVAAAMAQIREELGDDAIIVATSEDGENGVSVTAAIDEDPEPEDGDAGLFVPAGPAAARPRPAAAPAPARAPAPQMPQMPQMPQAAPGGWAVDPVDVVYRGFREHGLPAVVAEPLLEAVGGFETSDPRKALAAALREMFRFAPFGEQAWRRPVMPVGPPGAGKTQTVAKLAARGLVAGRRVAVLTTDTDRTGGIGHLSAFTEGLRLDLQVAGDAAALADGLAAVRGSDMILVDSAGRNHLDADDMESLAALLAGGAVEPFLVMPAGLDPVEAGEMARVFRELGTARMVVTRMDAARRLGSILAAAYAGGLGFAEFSGTPRIMNGLAPVDPVSLAQLLLPRQRQAGRRQRTGAEP
jgi:flagellar biosynthesis protein FlhF